MANLKIGGQSGRRSVFGYAIAFLPLRVRQKESPASFSRCLTSAMGVVVFTLLSSLFLYTVQGHAGPPAARPPDFETLRKSFNGDQPNMKRIIITKATTEIMEATTEKTATTKEGTEESEFANKNFSAEMHEEKTEENITTKSSKKEISPTAKLESINESVTEKTTTPEAEREIIKAAAEELTTIESTTKQETTASESSAATTLKRIEIRKIIRSTTPLPPPEDRLSPLEELRLLKKLSNQGIAFGVKNKELELIHNSAGELELPPFAFSDDENHAAEEDDVPEKISPTTTIQPKITTRATESTTIEPITETTTTSEESTTKPTTTKATTVLITESSTEKTAKVTKTTVPSTISKTTTTTSSAISDIEALEKELDKFKEEPFKIGTNIVPRHLFYDQSMGVHRRRKLANEKKAESKEAPELQREKEEDRKIGTTTTKTTLGTGPTRIPAVMQPFGTTSAPRTDDFLVPRPAEKDEDEKNLDSFNFPTTISDSANLPIKKSKRPEKMVLPILLEMPHLSSLSTFGSLSAPIHPNGLSQKIHPIRLDSDADLTIPVKSKNSGKITPIRNRRRLLRKKIVLAAPNREIEGITEPVKITPPPFKIVIKKKIAPKEKKALEKKNPIPPVNTKKVETPKSISKVVRTNDVAGQEQVFAASLTKKGTSTIELVLESLKKMKKATKMFLRKAKKGKAKANSAGKTVQAAPRIHSHDGSTGHVVKIDGNTDATNVVVDRDPARKTIDRDA